MSTRIRSYIETDRDAILICFAELQRYERSIEKNRADAALVAEPYVTGLLERCRAGEAEILVAEASEEVIGFIAVVAHQTSDDPLERDRDFAYISDLVVIDAYRSQGIGRRLLEAALESVAAKGGERIRVGVLAANEGAHRLYRSAGFRDYEIMLEADLSLHRR